MYIANSRLSIQSSKTLTVSFVTVFGNSGRRPPTPPPPLLLPQPRRLSELSLSSAVGAGNSKENDEISSNKVQLFNADTRSTTLMGQDNSPRDWLRFVLFPFVREKEQLYLKAQPFAITRHDGGNQQQELLRDIHIYTEPFFYATFHHPQRLRHLLRSLA